MAEAAYAPVTETLAPVVGPTPEEIERRKLMAAALLKNAMGSEPIGHWTQGVSNIVQALVAGRMEKKAGQDDAAAQAQAWQSIMGGVDAGIFGGGGGEYADVPGAEAVSGDDAATMRYAGEAPSAGTAAIYQGMLKRGMNPAQAAAFAASVQQESGGNPNANNPGEGARGIIQWRADRLRNLQGFAARQGKPWNDANTQMDFALWEMQNTEAGPGQMFRAAQTPEQANQALKRYIRYGDKAGPAGPAGWDSSKRLANTRRILGVMGGGETADIPGAEPVGSAPSPEVMAHITGGGATPAGMAFAPPAVPPPAPVASVPPPTPIVGQDAPVAGPPMPPQHPLARVPQARPEPAVAAAPAAPAVTGSVTPVARPVPMPPVKNDYATVPGRRPSVAPVRPGQLMQEPYSGPMSAQEFARQGQAAMRARAAGQQPAMAPVTGQPQQPRRNLLQALLGRGGPQGPASPPAAPAPSAAPAGGAVAPMDGRRAQIASLLANPRVPDALKLAALKSMTPQEREDYTLGQTRFSGRTNQPLASVPGEPDVTTRPLTQEERAARGIPANDPKIYQIDSTGKVSQVGGGGLNIDLSGGGSEKQIYETLGASADAARAAVTGLNGIREARTALQGGVITGAGADVRLGLQKLGAFLGVADPNVIQNTETFRAAIAPQVAAMLKATVGTAQISNTDRAFAEKAAGGDINLDQATIERLLGIMEKAGRVVVETHRKKLDAVYPEDGDYARERALFGVEAAEEEPPEASALDAARDAIARGADPEAVKRRLQENGIDPGLL